MTEGRDFGTQDPWLSSYWSCRINLNDAASSSAPHPPNSPRVYDSPVNSETELSLITVKQRSAPSARARARVTSFPSFAASLYSLPHSCRAIEPLSKAICLNGPKGLHKRGPVLGKPPKTLRLGLVPQPRLTIPCLGCCSKEETLSFPSAISFHKGSLTCCSSLPALITAVRRYCCDIIRYSLGSPGLLKTRFAETVPQKHSWTS